MVAWGAEHSPPEDARWYAKDCDASLEAAIRRLEMQDDTLPTRLERELEERERETSAGLWLRHKPDYGITIPSTGDPEAMMDEVEPFVEGTQWEGTVRIKRVEASEVESNAARAEAEQIFDRLDIPHEPGDNITKNRAEFYVANRTRFERELRASGLEFLEHVVVLEGMSRPDVPE